MRPTDDRRVISARYHPFQRCDMCMCAQKRFNASVRCDDDRYDGCGRAGTEMRLALLICAILLHSSHTLLFDALTARTEVKPRCQGREGFKQGFSFYHKPQQLAYPQFIFPRISYPDSTSRRPVALINNTNCASDTPLSRD